MKYAPRIVQLMFLAFATAIALVPHSPALVESSYSNGFYRYVNEVLTPVSNSLPISFGDVLLVAVVIGVPGWWVLTLVRAGKRPRLLRIPFLVLDTLTVIAFAYVFFALSWGLNYDREPLTAKLDYSEGRVTVNGEHELYALAVDKINQLAPQVHAQPFPSDDQIRPALHASFDGVVKDMGTEFTTFGPEPKRSLLNAYFLATGVTGFTDPWTHEVVLNETLLPVERPFTLAHEWSHLAGYASESEANFIGLLTCLRSDQLSIQYSGWLELYMWLPQPPNANPTLAPEVRADLQAIRERQARYENKQVAKTERDMYDRYLKANGVQEGIGNYGLFIRLVLGTRFTGNWEPQRRGLAGVPPASNGQP